MCDVERRCEQAARKLDERANTANLAADLHTDEGLALLYRREALTYREAAKIVRAALAP